MRNNKGRKKIGKIGVKCGLAMISCLLFAVPLFACRKTPAEPNNPELLLGFSQIGSESAWRVGNTTDIEEKAEEYGISLMFEDANQKQENQIAAIRRFIAYKVDVIAFSPIVEEGWDNVLTEAKDAGIPVILVVFKTQLVFPLKRRMISERRGLRVGSPPLKPTEIG